MMIAEDAPAGLAFAVIAGYLLGSIPFGLVLCRIAGLGDIRKIGSGNIGATNVLRTGSRPLAFLTLVLDTGKGAIAAFALLYLVGPLGAIFAGVAAVGGHNFPFWIRFKGGKGVATTLGTLLALSLPVGLGACITWLVMAALFRISSLAALVALGAAPVFAWYLGEKEICIATALLAVLCWIRHYQNIRRILAGDEPKIGNNKT